jgi:hypothetical protein
MDLIGGPVKQFYFRTNGAFDITRSNLFCRTWNPDFIDVESLVHVVEARMSFLTGCKTPTVAIY